MIFTNGKGKVYDIPEEKVEDALSHGLEPGFEMRNKDGKKYVIPKSKFDDAVKSGLEHEPIYQARLSSEKSYLDSEKKRLDSGLGRLETAGRAAADSLSLGLADEVQAGVRSLFNDSSYKDLRDNYRLSSKAASEVNPKTHLTSSLVSSVAPAVLMPNPASIGKMVASGAAIGGVQAFGGSEKEGLDLIEDVGVGATIGGAIPVAAKGVSKAADGLKWAGKKGLSAFTQLPEETIEHYWNRNGAVQAAGKLEDSARKVADGVGELAGRAGKGSSEAFDLLQTEGVTVSKEQLKQILSSKVQNLKNKGVFSKGAEREVAEIQGFLDSLDLIKSEHLTGPQAKTLMMQIDDSLGELKKRAADKVTAGQKELLGARAEIDSILKNHSPGYADKMTEVARDTKLAQKLNQGFGTNESAFNSLKNVTRERGNPFRKEMLEDLDATLGKDLAMEAKDAAVKEAFTGRSTNGSRNVLLGSVLGGGVDYLGDSDGGFVGGTSGAMIGYLVDIAAKPTAAKAMNFAKLLTSKTPVISFGKYEGVLKKALEKGPNFLLMTHRLLLEKDPEYRAVLEQK